MHTQILPCIIRRDLDTSGTKQVVFKPTSGVKNTNKSTSKIIKTKMIFIPLLSELRGFAASGTLLDKTGSNGRRWLSMDENVFNICFIGCPDFPPYLNKVGGSGDWREGGRRLGANFWYKLGWQPPRSCTHLTAANRPSNCSRYGQRKVAPHSSHGHSYSG